MLASKKELTSLKLRAIKPDDLKELAGSLGIDSKGSVSNLIKRLINISQNKINGFIRKKYQELVKARQKLISDNDLKIDKFFDNASVSTKDEIIFSFKKKTYTTISKILIISK